MSATNPSATSPLTDRLARLPKADRLLCRLMIGFALFALALGIAYGVTMALARAGAFTFLPDTPYRVLTVHGTAASFTCSMPRRLHCSSCLRSARGRVGSRCARLPGLERLSLPAVDLSAPVFGALTGTPLLYNANPELGLEDRRVVADVAGGYLLLSAGLVAISVSGIATTLAARRSEQASRRSASACSPGPDS